MAEPLRALVTGAGGFVGGYVARRLALEGMQVRAMVRDPDRPRVVDLDVPGVRPVRADLTDPASLRAAAEGAEVVVHAAADMRLRHAHVTRAVTVDGTRQMLLAARQGGARVFVHVSTIAVYAGSPTADEDAPLVPYGDRYGDAKIGAELALRELCEERADTAAPRVIILRPPAVYGPAARFWTVALAGLVARGLPACLDGGRGLFPYVYVENLADAVVAAIRAATDWERSTAGPAEDVLPRGGPPPSGRHPQHAPAVPLPSAHAPLPSAAAPLPDAPLPAADWPPCRAYNVVDGITTWAAYLGYFAAAYGRPVRSLPSWPFHALARLSEAAHATTGRRVRPNRADLRFLTMRTLPGYTADRAQRELGWHPRVSLDEGMARSLAWLQTASDRRAHFR